MKLESVRALKQELKENLTDLRRLSAGIRRASAVSVAPVMTNSRIALGIQKKGKDYKLAVRVQEAIPGIQDVLDQISQHAHGEVDLRIIGPVFKQQRLSQKKSDQLKIGASVKHIASNTTGTLGCFVTPTSVSRKIAILSNSHVLANENKANRGDPIVQPGKMDRRTPHIVARLLNYVRLKEKSNIIDAATAMVEEGIDTDAMTLGHWGKVSGVNNTHLDPGEEVFKFGQTTKLTRGRISAVELDDVSVWYNAGALSFDGQIEITSLDDKPFSEAGDSGSLIVDGAGKAIGLLFAGNNVVTFANPITMVIKALKVELCF